MIADRQEEHAATLSNYQMGCATKREMRAHLRYSRKKRLASLFDWFLGWAMQLFLYLLYVMVGYGDGTMVETREDSGIIRR